MMMKWSASGHYFAHSRMGEERDMAPCAPLAINVAMVLCHAPHVLPSCINQHGNWVMAASGLRGKQGRSVDRGLRLLLTTHGGSIGWMVLGNRGWRNGPQVSPLAQAFLSAMGRCVSPSILQECWPPKHDIVPRQPMNEVWAHITHCLDQVAKRSPLNITWDIFMWPESNESYWKEDCLPYSQVPWWTLAQGCRGSGWCYTMKQESIRGWPRC